MAFISGILCNVELMDTDGAGKICKRDLVQIGALQAEIPDAVMTWLEQQIEAKKQGGS